MLSPANPCRWLEEFDMRCGDSIGRKGPLVLLKPRAQSLPPSYVGKPEATFVNQNKLCVNKKLVVVGGSAANEQAKNHSVNIPSVPSTAGESTLGSFTSSSLCSQYT